MKFENKRENHKIDMVLEECVVCCLEEGFRAIFQKEKQIAKLANILELDQDYSIRHLANCSNESCSLHAHSVHVKSNNFVFKHPQLCGLTCFEIAHSTIAEGLWVSNSKFQYEALNSEKKRRGVVHSVRTNHPLYLYLRGKYGLDKKKRKKIYTDEDK